MSYHVWSRFTSAKSDGTTLKFRVQELPSDSFEDFIDFNMNYFVKEETFHRAAGISNRLEAMKECRGFITEMFKEPSQHIVVCCLDDDTDTVGNILGVSTMCLTTKDDDEDMQDLELQTNEVRKYFDLLEDLYSRNDVMKQYSLERYYEGRGIVVHPDFRGLGIATEFLKVRRLICKQRDVSITGAWMMSLGSQKAADRDAWQTVSEVSYDELSRRHNVTFEDAPPSAKLMIARV